MRSIRAPLRASNPLQKTCINTVIRPNKVQCNQKLISTRTHSSNIHLIKYTTNLAQSWISPSFVNRLFHSTPLLRESKEELETKLNEQIERIHLKFMEIGEQASYLSQMGKNKQAIQKYEEMKKFINQFPELFDDKIGGISCAQGLCHAALGEDKEALECFDLALSKQTTDAKMHFARGNILKKMGNVEEALSSYGTGLRLEKDPDILVQQGEIFMQMKIWIEAANSFENAIKLDPSLDEDIRKKLTICYNRLGKHEEAVSSANTALKWNPEDLELLKIKLDSFNKLKKWEDLLKTSEEALKQHPKDPSILQQKGIALSRIGKYNECLEAFEKAAEQEPNQPDVFFNTATAAFQKNEHATAVPFYEKALERLDLHLKGRAPYSKYFPALSLKEAEVLFKTSLQNKGICLTLLGKHQEAIDTFHEYFKLADKHEDSPAYLHMVRSLTVLGKLQDALDLCEKKLYSNPTDVRIMALKGQVLLKMGEFVEAIKYFDEAISRTPEDFNLHMAKAAALGRLGRNDEARVHLQRATQLAKVKSQTVKPPPVFEEFLKKKKLY